MLAIVQLEEKRRSWVSRLSGGQKQRLAVACALVSEPTTGLDPQSRRQLWEVVAGFRAERRTVILTTHSMEEAERLCDRVAIVDHGRIIALGTPRELIASLGGEHVVEFALENGSAPIEEAWLRGLPGVRDVKQELAVIFLTVTEVHRTVPALLDGLSRRGVALSLLNTHHATLEDVFVSLTGRRLRDD